MENVVYNEHGMLGYSVDAGVIPITERNHIQSVYLLLDEAKRTQEIRSFRKIDDSFKKIVVTKDIVIPHYDEYDILTVNIYDFLLDPHILEKNVNSCQ